jgi:hypothetical protein
MSSLRRWSVMKTIPSYMISVCQKLESSEIEERKLSPVTTDEEDELEMFQIRFTRKSYPTP